MCAAMGERRKGESGEEGREAVEEEEVERDTARTARVESIVVGMDAPRAGGAGRATPGL